MTTPAREALPAFLGIGAVKAGTTWLHRQLSRHPELYLPPQKPIYYFDQHYPQKPIARYAELFRPARGRLAGEFTASYSVLPAARIEMIRGLMPDLRLILLLREPRSRAWSEARMEFPVIRKRPLADVSVEELCEFLHSEKCRARGDYPAIIERWLAAFDRSQIFVGLYDDIIDRPAGLLRDLCAFLGLRRADLAEGADLTERVFASEPLAVPPACEELLADIYDLDLVERTAQLCGHDLARRWGYA